LRKNKVAGQNTQNRKKNSTLNRGVKILGKTWGFV